MFLFVPVSPYFFTGEYSDLPWHSRGQRFDPAYLHQRKLHRKPFGLRCFSLFAGKFQTFCVKIIFPKSSKLGFVNKKCQQIGFWQQKRRRKTAQRITGRLSRKEILWVCAYWLGRYLFYGGENLPLFYSGEVFHFRDYKNSAFVV